MRRKNERIDLAVVARQLESGKGSQSGRITYKGDALGTAAAALLSALDFAAEIPDSGRQRIIRDALFSFEPSTVITAHTLVAAVARDQAAYLRLPTEAYSLLTSVSATFTHRFRAIRNNRIRLRFYRDRPARFTRTRFEGISTWPKDSDSPNYTWVVATVNARTPHEGYERALRELDRLRGIWNFSLTRHVISRSSWSPRPLADIGLGRVHTLHRPTGTPVGEMFWYQSTFVPQEAAQLMSNWPRVNDDTKFILAKERSSPYASILGEIFVRYARALDGIDFDSAYLKLWSLLELLTATSNARYDQTISRALFVFREQELNRALLEHLREYRNASIHAAMSSDLAHDFCWQLKQYVDALIAFHIKWSGKFESWNEAAAFLDLPREQRALKKRLLMTRRALKYRGG